MLSRKSLSKRSFAKLAAAAALATGAYSTTAGAAVVTSSWLNAVNGTWSDATKWSGGVPNNGASSFSVNIGASSSPYTITLNTPTTINDLTISAPNAILDQTSGTFTVQNSFINLQSGTYRISGGTLSNSVISYNGGSLAFASFPRLNNVTVMGSLTLGTNNTTLGVYGTTLLGGSVNLTAANTAIGFDGTQTIAPNTFNLDGLNSFLSTDGIGTLTIPASAAVRGGNNGGISYGYVGAGGNNAVVNNGTIQADIAGKTFTILSNGNNTFTNNGTVAAINGSTLTIGSPNWSNPGTISANNSSLNFNFNWSSTGTINLNSSTLTLSGNFTSASLNTIHRNGGTINVVGAWNNTGNEFFFNSTTGDYNLNGGSITGGALTPTGSNGIRFSNFSTNRFIDVAYNATLNLDTPNVRLGISGGTLNGNVNISGNSAVLGFFNTMTISPRTYNLDGLSAWISAEGNAGTLTFPAGTVIRGGNSGGIYYGYMQNTGAANTTVINNGLIQSDVATRQFTIFPSGQNTFVNNGTVAAINNSTMTISAATWSNSATGNITANNAALIFFNNWSNAGTITLNNATLLLNGGFTTAGLGTINRTGGAVLVTGNWNNAGAGYTFNNSTGSFLLSGGTLTGGSINFTGGNKLGVATSTVGRVSAVTFNNDFDLNLPSSKLYVTGASTFNGVVNVSGNTSVLGFKGTQTISPTIYNLDGTGAYLSTEGTGGATLTIPAGALVRGGNDGGIWYGFIENAGAMNNTVVNNGTIRADIAGHSFSVFPSGSNTFNNNGTLQAVNGGKLYVNQLNGSANKVSADGLGSTVRLNGTYTLNQPVAVTNRSTLYLRGNWTKSADIDASGRVIFDYPAAGPSVIDTIRAQIKTGRNGGLWNGPGINSSAAASTPGTALGYGEASTIVGINGGYYSGESVDPTAVLVRWTRLGDGDLDGDADGVDIGRWATNFTGELGGGATATLGWTQGDWDYDGDVDGVDAGLWATAFTGELGGAGLSSVVVNDPSLSPQAAQILAGIGVTVVPEPAAAASLGLAMVLGLASSGFRPRRQRIRISPSDLQHSVEGEQCNPYTNRAQAGSYHCRLI